MSEPILETKRLSKAFGGLLALDKVDLAIETGTITAIIGPNGAGKTTLFNVITGVFPASDGEILFEGTPLKSAPAHKRAALGIAQPTVSKHLKILEEAGLVYYEKDGLWVNYFLADGTHIPYAASLLGNIKHWLDDDAEVSELNKKVPFLNRSELC